MILNNVKKIFVVGDLHLGIYNNTLAWRDNQFAYLKELLNIVRENGFNPHTDILVFLGDVFTVRESLNIMIANYALDLFKELAKIFVKGIYIIAGNHDTYYKDHNDINSLKIIDNIADNIHVYNEPQPALINGNINCLFLPWVADAKKIGIVVDKYMDTPAHGENTYLFAHLEINGMRYDNGMRITEGISKDHLKAFKRVYSGHIHKHQSEGNILYTGAPYQMDRGDIGNQKGIYMLDVNGIDNSFDETFIPNTLSPIFNRHDMYDILSWDIDKISGLLHNNYIDLNTDRNLASKMNFIAFTDMLKDNEIIPKKLEFPTYNNNDGVVADLEYTGELNLFSIGTEILKAKKKTEKESTTIMTYFDTLLQKVKEKENERI